MAIKAVSMDTRVEYVSKLDPAKGTDRELDDGTVFTLGTLTNRVQSAIKDKATSFRQDPERDADDENPDMIAEFRPNESTYLMVQFGLRGWNRFIDTDGGEVKFETTQRQLGGQSYTVVSPKSMDRLGLELTRELAEEVEKLNTPEKDEAKS